MPKYTTIRVDPEVYAILVERKQQLERERGHPVSISEAVKDLFREAEAKPAVEEEGR
jgi:hypothetical protein